MGAALTAAAGRDSSVLGVYGLFFFLTTLGIVYVQDAERQIPITYASRYRAGALQQQAYLPFKASAPLQLCMGGWGGDGGCGGEWGEGGCGGVGVCGGGETRSVICLV